MDHGDPDFRPLSGSQREFCSRLGPASCGFETDGLNERVEVVDDALIEPVEERSVLTAQLGVGSYCGEKAGGQRSAAVVSPVPKSYDIIKC